MKKSQRTCRMIILTACLLVAAMVDAFSAPSNLPAGYRFIGRYQLNSHLRVEAGKCVPILISPVTYEVYSDGMEARIYCTSTSDTAYTAYKIYRSDGIGVKAPSGALELVAGVQGICQQGELVRQVSITRSSLTMVKMPPRSHRVVITRALAMKKKSTDQSEETSKSTSPNP